MAKSKASTKASKSQKEASPSEKDVYKKNPRLMSPRYYARLKGLHPNTIYQAVKDGRLSYITKQGRNFIDADVADQEFAALKILEDAPPEDKIDPLTISESDIPAPNDRMTVVHARALREEFKARQEHLDYQRRKGELIPRTDVDAAAFECARILREQISSIPDRICAELAAETDPQKVHFVLSEALNKILADLSEHYTDVRMDKPLVAPQPEAAAEVPENAITV